MKFFVAVLALAATAIAAPTECKSCHKEPSHEHKPEHKEPSNNKVGNVCQSHQTVVCQGQGNGGLLSLGNILPGALGQNCAGGDVYCCSHDDVKQVRARDSIFSTNSTDTLITGRPHQPGPERPVLPQPPAVSAGA